MTSETSHLAMTMSDYMTQFQAVYPRRTTDIRSKEASTLMRSRPALSLTSQDNPLALEESSSSSSSFASSSSIHHAKHTAWQNDGYDLDDSVDHDDDGYESEQSSSFTDDSDNEDLFSPPSFPSLSPFNSSTPGLSPPTSAPMYQLQSEWSPYSSTDSLSSASSESVSYPSLAYEAEAEAETGKGVAEDTNRLFEHAMLFSGLRRRYAEDGTVTWESHRPGEATLASVPIPEGLAKLLSMID